VRSLHPSDLVGLVLNVTKSSALKLLLGKCSDLIKNKMSASSYTYIKGNIPSFTTRDL